MPLPVYHLRRLLAATAAILSAVVMGMYFYARMQTRDVRRDVPHKLGYDISKTANGFQISKSDGGRTLFRVRASDVTEFKLNGHAELQNVTITLYGRDSTRFDQISGDHFSFDEKSGDIRAKGEVQIDLVANPTGVTSPDQTAPQTIRNPIHLKTRDLVFNKDSGNASTDARVDFATGQATGWAVGAKYAGKENLLTLVSQIHVTLNGPNAAVIEAEHGIMTNDPREVVLDHPHLDHEGELMQSDRAEFHLDSDNNVQSVLATGNVTGQTRNETETIHTHADQGDFQLTEKGNLLRTVTLTGNVHIEQAGPQPMQGDAPRVVLDYAGRNELQKVHALDGARLIQKSAGSKQPGAGSGPQDFELTAPIIDFAVAGKGRVLTRAETSGAARITITPPQQQGASAKGPQKTVVTAGKFTAKFDVVDGKDHLTSMHGAPDVRIVSSSAGEPDRVSTSDAIDGVFLPQGGVESMTQLGHVAYNDGLQAEKRTQAWADKGLYTPADQLLVLTGSPRVATGSMLTTAKVIRMNRATGDATAESDVKSTYSEVKEQPDGALLASSSPIHVNAQTMTAHKTPGIALYTGNARLWQDANIIEAPSIQFDRERRFVTAQGTSDAPVLTTLVQPLRPGDDGKDNTKNAKGAARTSPIAITGARLTYADSERKAHYEGGVIAKGSDFTANAKSADAYLVPRSQTAASQSVGGLSAGPSRLDHMVATDDVVVVQPGRRADGQKLVYTANDDKFVLTGGSSKELPSIFDAEQGKITGVSLTFFRRDDRVLVEGEAGTPVVTHTRVAR